MYEYKTSIYQTTSEIAPNHKQVVTYADAKFDAELQTVSVEGWHLHTLLQRPSGDLMAVYERWALTDEGSTEVV